MNWKNRTLALLMSFGLVAAACGDESASTDAASGDESTEVVDAPEATTTTTAASTTTAAPTTVEETTSTVALPVLATELTLLDPGAEPRSELRLNIADGTTQNIILSQRQILVQELGGEPLQDLEISVVATQEFVASVIDGGYRLTGTVTSAEAGPDIDPATSDEVTASLQNMVGLVSETEIDDRGNLIASRVSGGEGLDAATQEMVQSLSQAGGAPLPDEAVGVGASWEVTQELEIGGAPVAQTTLYTVTAIDGSIVTLETETSQTIEPGSKIVQTGLEIEVSSWTNNGSGTIEIDLSQPVPTSSGTSSATQELLIPGSDDLLTQTFDSTIEISNE